MLWFYTFLCVLYVLLDHDGPLNLSPPSTHPNKSETLTPGLPMTNMMNNKCWSCFYTPGAPK